MKRRRGAVRPMGLSTEEGRQEARISPGLKRKPSASVTPARSSSRIPTPQHMNARSRAASATASLSPASVASAGSRRNSLDGVTAQVGGSDIDSERPAKRSRATTSDASSNGQSPAQSENSASKIPSIEFSNAQDDFSGQHNRSSDVIHLTRNDITERAETANGSLASNTVSTNGLTSTLQLPPPKRRGRRPKLVQRGTPADSTDATPTPPTPLLQSPDADSQSQPPNGIGHKPAKIVKRLPGRRRAPHANLDIEADLRRQLSLKMGYRAVAKALKPLLAELAQRTANQVEDDGEAYKKCEEYAVVMAELDARLHERLDTLDHKYRLKCANLKTINDAEVETRRSNFELIVRDLQEDYLTHCRHQLLELERETNRRQGGDATDDEDDPVLGIRGPNGKTLGHHDSRSRFFIEADRLWARAEVRHSLRTQQADFVQRNVPNVDATYIINTEDFATYDGDRRDYASAVRNADLLVAAADAIENPPATPMEARVEVIPHSSFEALRTLAEAASRPERITTQSTAENIPQSAQAAPVKPHTVFVASTPFPPYSQMNGIQLIAHTTPDKGSRPSSPRKVKTANRAAVTASSLSTKTHSNKIIDILNEEPTLSPVTKAEPEVHAPTSGTTPRREPVGTIWAPSASPMRRGPEINEQMINSVPTDVGPKEEDNVPLPTHTFVPQRDADQEARKPSKSFWSALARPAQFTVSHAATMDRAPSTWLSRRLKSRNAIPDKIGVTSAPEASKNVPMDFDRSRTGFPSRMEHSELSHGRHQSPASVNLVWPETTVKHAQSAAESLESLRHRLEPAWEVMRRASISAPQQHAAHSMSPTSTYPSTSVQPPTAGPRPHQGLFQPPVVAPYPSLAPGPPISTTMSPYPQDTATAYGYPIYASPYNNHGYQMNGYVPPNNGHWPTTEPSSHHGPPLAPLPIQQPHALTPDPRFQAYPSYPSAHQQYVSTPYSAPVVYTGPQYGGQPILPANSDPRYGTSPYGQPPHPPAFSQHQSQSQQGAGSQHGHQNQGGSKRRPRSYSAYPHTEFRRYHGPRQR